MELNTSAYRHFTPDNLVSTVVFQPAIKTAPTQIRLLTERDVAVLGETFLDLEGRIQQVKPGRYLCLGTQGEMWTCSEKSMAERMAISEPDADGFQLYVQRNPQPVLVAEIAEPFTLDVHGDVWTSQEDGGVVTWNGQTGDTLQMRVIARDIFAATYQFSEATGEASATLAEQQPTPCAAEGCPDTGTFLCDTCHHLFCLRHIVDLNEDRRYGEEPIWNCTSCAPWNEQGMLDLPEPYEPDEED